MADPAEGTFGARAEDAVKAFPAARALPADGSAGTATWAALRTGR